jgi:hypothetical protein
MSIRRHADHIVMHPHPRSFVAWLAILSLLLNGLMPLVVHAAGKEPAAAMVVCSTSASGQPAAPLKSGAAHFHCAYCCSSTDGAALPTRAASHGYMETVAGTRKIPGARMPVDLRFGSAQARAPPLL